ncbi:MAG TPA: hypothetical protein VJ831_08885 [Jatrophihabitantaceae bacterium]|nr:hypothetical protein [Jatrophihabitantaceae bacterium]
MLIDCDTCTVRGAACRDCVVPLILSNPALPAAHPVEIDESEQDAIDTLAAAGLVPPLRLVSGMPGENRGIA